MKRYSVALLSIFLFGVFVFHAPLASAENPFGWLKGKKAGWQGKETPKGLSEKDAEKAAKDAEKEAKKTQREAEKKSREVKKAAEKRAREAQKAAEKTAKDAGKATDRAASKLKEALS